MGFVLGQTVNHVKFPEEFGLGEIISINPNGNYIVRWEDEFGHIETCEHEESDLE